MDRRLSRRKPPHRLALYAGALVLAVPVLASCGFDQATDRVNTIVNGTSDQDGVVDVLNAMVVSSEEGSGTFIATLSNNSPVDAISLDSLSFGSDATVQVAGFDPVEVPPHGLVNLADVEQGIKVAGEFGAGEFINLTLGFSNGEAAEMQVPVVTEDGDYTGLDNGTGVPSPAEPSASESAS
jgi:hypothetical protein